MRSPARTPRDRGLSVETVRRIVDEAVALGFQRLFFTGGEPFILDDIYEMLAYAAARAETIVLTNASLLRGRASIGWQRCRASGWWCR